MIKNICYVILGFLSMSLGLIGIVIPILPTAPFLVFSSFCFIQGSPKVRTWYEGTSLYKKHMITLKQKGGLTLKTKLRILIPFYCVLCYLIIINDIFLMRVFILALMIIKTIVFIRIKTVSKEELFS